MFDDFKNRIVSLDVETTGLDQSKDKIWSVGMSSESKGMEFFSNPTDSNGVEAIQNNLASKGTFMKSQVDGGKLNPLFDAIKGNNTIPQGQVADNLFNEIDKRSIILIQNANFENKMVSELIKGLPQDRQDALWGKMMYSSQKEQGKLLFTPPQVTSLRQRAAVDYKDFLNTGSPQAFDRANESYKNILEEYQTHSKKTNGAFVIELMDVTKATFASAASKGFLDKSLVNSGTSVEFLSKSLLGEKELHTALSDADQQRRIFDELGKINSEISSGKISESTYDKLARIKATQPYETSRQMLKGIRNTVEEIQQGGTTRITAGDSTLAEGQVKSYISVDEAGGATHQVKLPIYSVSAIETSSIDAALFTVGERYKNVNTPGVDKAALFSSMSGKSADEVLQMVGEGIEKIEGKQGKVATLFDDTASFGDRVAAGKVKADDTLSSGSEKIKRMSPERKWQGGLAIAAAGLLGMATRDAPEKTKDQRSKEQIEHLSLDNTLSNYGNTLHHGSSLANWQNRTGHHGY